MVLNSNLEKILNTFPEKHPYLFLFFVFLGVSVVWSIIKPIIKTLLEKYFKKKAFDFKKYGKGSWALIDTCDSESAKSFSIDLANNGFNLLLLMRKTDHFYAEKIRVKITSNNLKHIVHKVGSKHSERITLIKELLQEYDISIIVSSCLQEEKQKNKDDFNHLKYKIEEVFQNAVLTLRIALPKLKARERKSAFLLLKGEEKKRDELRNSIIDNGGDKFISSFITSANLEFGSHIEVKYI